MRTLRHVKTNFRKEYRLSFNDQKRVVTIYSGDIKFRTYPMSKEEYNSASDWTGNDWYHFMKTNDYYKVK